MYEKGWFGRESVTQGRPLRPLAIFVNLVCFGAESRSLDVIVLVYGPINVFKGARQGAVGLCLAYRKIYGMWFPGECWVLPVNGMQNVERRCEHDGHVNIE